MTKSQELELLLKFTASLPDDSYMKKWLTSVYASVKQDITSDIFPYADPVSTYAECKMQRENTRLHIETITNEAKREATRLVANAEAEAIRINGKLNQAKAILTTI
jgi:hypothetical protein